MKEVCDNLTVIYAIFSGINRPNNPTKFSVVIFLNKVWVVHYHRFESYIKLSQNKKDLNDVTAAPFFQCFFVAGS